MASGLGCNKIRLVLRKRHERTLSSALLGGSGRAIREDQVSYSLGKRVGALRGGLRPPNMLS